MSAHHSDGPRFLPRKLHSRPVHYAAPGSCYTELPQYKVVLLRDAVNDLPFIVRTVMELTRLYKDEATFKMWEAHHSGRSVLLRTYRERAEMYVELFTERGLLVTLEPA